MMFYRQYSSRKLMVFFIVFLLGACTTPSPKQLVQKTSYSPADRSRIYIKFPQEKEVVFLGKLSADEKENLSGNIMYPANNAGMLLVGILTHAMIQGGVDAAQEKNKREEANKVLDKYQNFLTHINGAVLVENESTLTVGLKNIALMGFNNELEAENVYMAHVRPIYSLAQNERSLVLSNKIQLTESQWPKVKQKTVNIEYVSSPFMGDNPTEYWMNDDFQAFSDTSKKLFMETLRIALSSSDISKKKRKQQTIRYYESGKKKIERGMIVKEDCDRLLFISLRGVIKSVPVFDVPSNCTSSDDIVAKTTRQSVNLNDDV